MSKDNLADSENLRWMVFKVKQKSQADYFDKVFSQAGQASNATFLRCTPLPEDEYLQFNWPYDYLSFVELIKMDAEVLFKAGSESGEMGNSGLTSKDSKHRHNYTLDENGNGWTTEAGAAGVIHKHQVKNWEVLESQSGCYPDCKKQYGSDGSGPHTHTLLNTTNGKSK